MKKSKGILKKILGTFAALAMAVGVVSASAVPVKADDGVKITIDDNQPTGSSENGPTYDWYVMMWASVALDSSGKPTEAIAYNVDKLGLANALSNLHLSNSSWSTETPAEGDSKLFTVTQINGENYWSVTVNKKADNTDYTAQEVASALDKIVTQHSNDLTNYTEQTGSVNANSQEEKSFTIQKNGYVLIKSSLGNRMLLDTFQEKVVHEKNEYPTVTKTQSKSENSTFSNADVSAEVGQKVYYHLDIAIPMSAGKDIFVNDTTSKGLTISNNATISSLKVNGQDVSFTEGETSPLNTQLTWADKTSSPAPQDGSHTYQIKIDSSIVTLLASKATESVNDAGETEHYPVILTISYYATVNKDALMESPWNTNTSNIKYDNYTSVDSKVTTKVFKFNLDKRIETATGEHLPGVKFTLTRQEGSTNSKTLYYTAPTDSTGATEARFKELGSGETIEDKKVITDNQGSITFTGLAAGTYTLTETDTVAGYRGLASSITITIDEDGKVSSNSFAGAEGSKIGKVDENGTVVIVINQRGTALPSTGGMGTKLFYIAGGALILVAAGLLISRKKKENA